MSKPSRYVSFRILEATCKWVPNMGELNVQGRSDIEMSENAEKTRVRVLAKVRFSYSEGSELLSVVGEGIFEVEKPLDPSDRDAVLELSSAVLSSTHLTVAFLSDQMGVRPPISTPIGQLEQIGHEPR